MNITRFLKPIVFTLECIKLLIIALIIIIQGNVPGLFIKILLAAPGALFPLMALFIWLDTNRYKEYIPLFSAGKCIGIFLLLGWFILFRQVTMIGSIFGLAIYAEGILLFGDLLSLGAVFLINREISIEIKNHEMEES
ncbi:MAG: hypothetical protein FWF68_02900 [Spirochaetes bacterium]|nr:hypothetical protein [Spirochaetota bacterium]